MTPPALPCQKLARRESEIEAMGVLRAHCLGHGPDWGGYSVDDTARRHGAGVEKETTDQFEAYASLAKRAPTRYREGWLPES